MRRGAVIEPPVANPSIEGARVVVLSEVRKTYGAEADPFLVRLDAESVRLQGRPALRLEVIVGFGGAPREMQDQWTYRVGLRDEGPVVLRAVGPSPPP